MSFGNALAPDSINVPQTGLGTTVTGVASGATVSACLTAIAAALIAARNGGNSTYIEQCLDHLQRAGRSINLLGMLSF